MLRKLLRGLAVAITVLAIVAVPAFALQGDTRHDPAADQAGCVGIANAYAHVSANQERNGNEGNALEALAAVAEKHDCDLATGAVKPHGGGNGDEDKGEQKDEDADDAKDGDDASSHVPDPNNPHGWDMKCDQIAEHATTAEAREHGNSAAAFARQADHWGC
jgi:hypothetical protein